MVKVVIGLFPETVSALKGVRVVSHPGTGWKFLDQPALTDPAAALARRLGFAQAFPRIVVPRLLKVPEVLSSLLDQLDWLPQR